ncbi:pyrimidine 5'-nucleotidase [Terasakiella sp. A23]|uniref:pyrimidine 5'-nucleotidase n=1 Tax=Terasakiella sp. FCG-A23 TaxID=3080561 RepID=UPI00295370F4|nr:pyrimidine 5'-nucleotidase [Terasakiella sp. A23]MDV7339726.1 pyrimidine 5'-nucleotidase [Terasakiella sp. A23]
MIPDKDIQSWVFDLDNTLYPASCNLFAQVDIRMRDFISNLLGLGSEDARVLQKQYFRDHGTTLRGLMTNNDIDPKPYLDYVHDIDVSPVQPAPDLSDTLAALPGKKYIFTNASTGHAERVMDRLGIAQHFDGIFDIVDADYQPKPEPSIYDTFISRFNIDPTKAIMVEDMARNLKPAADLGMLSLWVETESDWAREGANEAYVHHKTDNLLDWLKGAL